MMGILFRMLAPIDCFAAELSTHQGVDTDVVSA